MMHLNAFIVLMYFSSRVVLPPSDAEIAPHVSDSVWQLRDDEVQ